MTSGICTALMCVPRTENSGTESGTGGLGCVPDLILFVLIAMLAYSLGEDLEIKNELEMSIQVAHECGAADGITPPVDLKACLIQDVFYPRVVDSFAGMILGQIS